MSIFTATVVFPIETFEGGQGANRSLYPIFNCSIVPGETLERWGEQNTWGPYGRQVENVIMGDAAPVMIWIDHYESVTRPTTQTVEVIWIGKDGHQHQGTLWSDGQWISQSKDIPGRFGLGFIRGKVKEVFPNFFDA